MMASVVTDLMKFGSLAVSSVTVTVTVTVLHMGFRKFHIGFGCNFSIEQTLLALMETVL